MFSKYCDNQDIPRYYDRMSKTAPDMIIFNLFPTYNKFAAGDIENIETIIWKISLNESNYKYGID